MTTKKRLIVFLATLLTVAAGTAHAGNVGFSIGVNVGVPVSYAPAPVYIPTQAPVYVPAPAPVYAPAPPPPVEVSEPPQFIIPQELGFRVAVGVPYDLFYVSNSYYACRNNAWYRAPFYGGPWTTVRYRALPWELRRYPVATIRSYRDAEFRRHDNGNHGGWGHDRDWRNQGRWQEARQWGKGHDRHGNGRDDD